MFSTFHDYIVIETFRPYANPITKTEKSDAKIAQH